VFDDVVAGETDLLSYKHLKSVSDEAREISQHPEYHDMERVGFRNDSRYAGDKDNYLGFGKLNDASIGRFSPDVLPLLKNVDQGLNSRDPNGWGRAFTQEIKGALADATGTPLTPVTESERTFPFDRTLSGRVSRLQKDIGYILERNGGKPVNIGDVAPTAAFDELAPAQRAAFARWSHEIEAGMGPIQDSQYVAKGPLKGMWRHSDGMGGTLFNGAGVNMHYADDLSSLSLTADGITRMSSGSTAVHSFVRPDGILVDRIGKIQPSGIRWDATKLSAADGSVHIVHTEIPTAPGQTPNHKITVVNSTTGVKETIETNKIGA
jgi:hypothetical protein